ncbi:signal peptidase II [Methylovirgula sp. HY1]|uniref:signal peptidase II n=1 Tax=Methylovirgula sp. HY1 TaxID=2822761 RepID=UPI001C5B2B1F|nr:signal peptidase II [Methylovirgula sp. HY1]QXX74501.1 Lipoprotein signal peptidase [Methylovirgula sp. HY1]
MKPRWIGFLAALVALVLDQANKIWLIDVYGIAQHQPVRLTPFLDVIFAKNPGISYSLFSAKTAAGRFVLIASAMAVTAFLVLWLWRSRTVLTALGLGLIIGGALGNNACDRFFYGYVADFYHFHIGDFSWYVFNLADVAITFGVILLLYESLFGKDGEPSRKTGRDKAAMPE